MIAPFADVAGAPAHGDRAFPRPKSRHLAPGVAGLGSRDEGVFATIRGQPKDSSPGTPMAAVVREALPKTETVLCLLCLEPVTAHVLATHFASVHGARPLDEPAPAETADEAGRSPELLQAAALLAVGHDDDALLAMETAVERDPDLEEGWFQKGMLHIARREYPESLLCLERALLIDARDPRAWVAKFLALERLGGRSAEAARCLIKAADLDPLFTQRWIAERFTEEELKEIRKRYGGGPATT